MRPTEAAQLVAMLCTAFDVPAWSDDAQELFRKMIVDLEYAPALSAVRLWMQSESKRPTIADIRGRTAREMERAGVIPHELDVVGAQRLVTKLTRDIGHTGRFPIEKYPLVWEAMEAVGGWWSVCRESASIVLAQFGRAYQPLLDRRHVERLAAPGLKLADDAIRLAALARPDTPAPGRAALPQPPLGRAEAIQILRQIGADSIGCLREATSE